MRTHRHRRLAHAALTRAALTRAAFAAEPTAQQIALGFNDLCHSMTAELQPLFGVMASKALFARAVDLAGKEYPWISNLPLKNGHCADEALPLLDQTATANDLHVGLAAVLAYNIELLVALVGEDLVLPLVRKAWPVVEGELAGD